MAKKPTEGQRKLVEFDAPTWHALNLLSRESMKSFQELADEAFRDLLHKHGRPTDLKSALREIAKGAVSGRRRQARWPIAGSGGLLGWWRRRHKIAS